MCASAHRDSDVDILTVEFGVQRQIDLIPGGSEIPVTAENRHECEQNVLLMVYLPMNNVDIQLVCKYKLDKQIAAQSKAFFIGLSDLLDSKCGFITVW